MWVHAWLPQRCLKVFEGYPASCLDRIRGTDPSTVSEHGIFTRSAEAMPPDGWGRGRVTLVGDAAHPVRPTGDLPAVPLLPFPLSHITGRREEYLGAGLW